MTINKVDGIPAIKRYTEGDDQAAKKRVNKLLEGFMRKHYKYAIVEFTDTDYKDVTNAINSISMSVRRAGLPIKVHSRQGKVYLERRDM